MENKLRPAFPNPREKWETGIDKFEWFAAHAPDMIPEWFEHSMEEKPPPPPMPNLSIWMSTHKHAALFKRKWDFETDDWYEGFGGDDPQNQRAIYVQLKAEAIEYLKELGENLILLKEWKATNQYERFFQWRAYYAIKMCEL